MAVQLLKTPTAQLAVNGGSQHPDKRKAGGHGPTLADQVEHQLLPTPRATDGTKGGPNQRGSSGDLMLPSAVMELLPTPAARDFKSGKSNLIGTNARPLSEVVEMTLLPTPTAADGDRMSATYPRGNETLIGALLPTPRVTGRPGMRPSPSTVRGTHGMDLGPAIGALLPTPCVADAEGTRATRGGDRSGEMLLTGIARRVSAGDLTKRRSDAGKPSLGGTRHVQPSLDEPESA
jgi:hypothetical protein